MKGNLRLVIEPGASFLLAAVNNFLAKQDVKSYLVGGFVRDILLGRDTADIDIAVAADALEVAPKLATVIGGKYVLLDEVNRVGRVVLVNREGALAKGQRELDFSTFWGDISEDLARRDFTIDAMAVDLGELNKGYADVHLVDPFNGWDDLQRGVIRTVSPGAFQSDPARLLRAVRLAVELGFSIDNETEAQIRHYSHLITSVAGERIREELLRLLAGARSAQFLHYLEELGLLTTMIPELALAKGVEQPKEHFWDVFDHSLETVDAVDFLLRQGTWEYCSEEVLAVVPWSERLARHFDQEVSGGSTRRLMLKLAALLHDIAKPQTKAIDANGRTRFLGHGKDGAAMAANILERLRFSGREIKLAETTVRHHLRPGQMSHEKLPSRRAIYRYFRDTGEAGIDILFLSLADHLATRGQRLVMSEWREHAHVVEYVLSQRFQGETVVTPPKLVNGHDLINIFGMSPGRKVGEVLEAVCEAQAAGELTTRYEALAFVRKQLLATAIDSKEGAGYG